MSNLEINAADWSVSRKTDIILLPSGQCDNGSAKAALLWRRQECLHARETESERQGTASICEQRQRQRSHFQRCSGETGDGAYFRRRIWKGWNSPHAREHPICEHLTSTQEICERRERRNVTGVRKGISTPCIIILILTTVTQLLRSTPPFFYLFPHIHLHNAGKEHIYEDRIINNCH